MSTLTPDLRAWVAARVAAIIDAGHGAELAAQWPAGVPTLKASAGHDEAALDAIADVCTQVEADHWMPFGSDDPRKLPVPTLPLVQPREPVDEGVDEGERVDQEEVDALRAALGNLEPHEQAFVETVADLCSRAGASISLVNRATRRRVEIAWALITLSDMTLGDAFALVAGVAGSPAGGEVGAVVGRLSTDQAKQLQALTQSEKASTR